MGIILNLLTSKDFRLRPMMFVGSRNFKDISYWLQGIEFCCHDLQPNEPPALDGFREWLQMKLDGPGNTNWQGVISSVFGEEDDATEKMFELLDEFLVRLREVGLDQIIEDHTNYEIQRYGRVTSGRALRQ